MPYSQGKLQSRICRPFKEPRNRFPAWRTGTTTLLAYRPARLHRLAKSIPRIRFLGSITLTNTCSVRYSSTIRHVNSNIPAIKYTQAPMLQLPSLPNQDPNSERDSILPWAVKSSFKTGLQISSWKCQNLAAEQLLLGHGYGTDRLSQYKSSLHGHSPPAKLGRTPCWAGSLDGRLCGRAKPPLLSPLSSLWYKLPYLLPIPLQAAK
jgi:hypothetical protein